MAKPRKIQPAHTGGTVTVSEAQRAFREVRDAPATESTDVAKLFVEHLPVIDQAAESLARRYGLPREDAQEFASWVKVRLLENDYVVLRKFRGESAFKTYLVGVTSILFHEWRRVEGWSRWKASAAARRQGALAVRLEELVNRQGFTIEQAGEMLRTRGDTDLSDLQLARLFEQVGYRPLTRPASATTDERPESTAEASEEAQNLLALLLRAMEELNDEDRAILRLLFWDERNLAEAARTLGIPQKPLYRRMARLLARLRQALIRDGVSTEDVRTLLDEVDP